MDLVYLIKSDSICLLIGMFRPFMCNVIVGVLGFKSAIPVVFSLPHLFLWFHVTFFGSVSAVPSFRYLGGGLRAHCARPIRCGRAGTAPRAARGHTAACFHFLTLSLCGGVSILSPLPRRRARSKWDLNPTNCWLFFFKRLVIFQKIF